MSFDLLNQLRGPVIRTYFLGEEHGGNEPKMSAHTNHAHGRRVFCGCPHGLQPRQPQHSTAQATQKSSTMERGGLHGFDSDQCLILSWHPDLCQKVLSPQLAPRGSMMVCDPNDQVSLLVVDRIFGTYGFTQDRRPKLRR